MMKNLTWNAILSLFLVVFLTSCGDDEPEDNTNDGPGTVTAEISGEARFSILVDALTRTGLDSSLDKPGTFTVFAPTNDAFSDLFSELGVSDLDGAINALGKEAVSQVLRYHLLQTEVKSGDISSGFTKSMAANANGNLMDLYLNKASGEVSLNERATVQETNLNASNGLVHVIDQVLLPLSVFQIVELSSDLSSLRTAVTLADGNVDQTLGDLSRSFTFFAPNNAAFDTIIAQTPNVNELADLVAQIGTSQLENVLLYHTLGNELQSQDITIGSAATLAANASININITGNTVTISDQSAATSDATVVVTDLTAQNGVVHKIDNLLLPN